jgi:hypothetical protein
MPNQHLPPYGYRDIIETETGMAYGSLLYHSRYDLPAVRQGGHLVVHRQRAVREYVPPAYHGAPPIGEEAEYQLPTIDQAPHQSLGYAASSRNQLDDPRTSAQDPRSAYDGAEMVGYQNPSHAPSSNRALRQRGRNETRGLVAGQWPSISTSN